MKQIGLLFYLLIFMKSSNCAQKVRCKSALARQGLGSSENELYGFLSRITPSEDLKKQAIRNENENQSYSVDCVATSCKSALRIWLF